MVFIAVCILKPSSMEWFKLNNPILLGCAAMVAGVAGLVLTLMEDTDADGTISLHKETAYVSMASIQVCALVAYMCTFKTKSRAEYIVLQLCCIALLAVAAFVAGE
mgnify:FL=1